MCIIQFNNFDICLGIGIVSILEKIMEAFGFQSLILANEAFASYYKHNIKGGWTG